MSHNLNSVVDTHIDGDDITKISRTLIAKTDQSNTTTFTNQNPTQVVSVLSQIPHDSEVVNSATSGYADQSIDSFMKKPVPVVTGLLTTVPAAGTLLTRFNIAPTLLATPIWAEKLKGFINVRGTAKIKLQLNANPFQAGRLILAYIPQYEHNLRPSGQHLRNLQTITQLPHVEMSFQDAEAELEIPYISPTTHFNIQSGEYDWGTVFLFLYSPFVTGAAVPGNISYTIWMSFDDFEVQVPIVPQSSTVSATQRGVIRKYRSKRIRSTLDSEINEGKGPVSSILSSVSSITATLCGVPMLTPIAGPLSWFTNLSAGVASAFGWSKPILDSQPCRMVSNSHPYLANTNEPDVSNVVALTADNRVSVMPDVNLSGVDEMAISFIKRQKAFIASTSWDTSTAVGLLTTYDLHPSTFTFALPFSPFGLTTSASAKTYAPIAFLTEIFEFYRGSIELTFKIVKTQYHTGRLMVVYSPQVTNVVSPTLSQTNYAMREVIDLRDGNEFCLTFPYCHNTMYSSTDLNQTTFRPKVYLYVLNELVAPESVSQSVQILVEVRGGHDLEYQVPKRCNRFPIDLIAPQAAGDDQVQPIVCSNIGNSVVHDPSSMASQLCIGESCTSLLVLMKRYLKFFSDVTSFPTASRLEVYPYIFGSLRSTGVAGGGTAAVFVGDYLSLFASMYAHSRGGVRFRIVCDAVSESDTTVGSFIGSYFLRPTSNSPVFFGSSGTETGLGLPTYVGGKANGPTTFDSSYASGTAVSFPMYNRTYCRLNRLSIDNSAMGSASDVCPFSLSIDTTQPFGTNASVYRCAADDFHMSFWLGVPPLAFVA